MALGSWCEQFPAPLGVNYSVQCLACTVSLMKFWLHHAEEEKDYTGALATFMKDGCMILEMVRGESVSYF